jgi:DNA-binding NarL/FixJ family response regulator
MVVQCDESRCEFRDCGAFWPQLRAGVISVADSFSTEERAYLVLHQRGTGTRLSARHWDILERILLGQSQKVIAFEFGVAVSTIAGKAKLALQATGVQARVSGVQPLLCLLAHASLTRLPMDAVRASQFEHEGVRYDVLSMAMRSSTLMRRLPPAEQSVVLMRLEGRSLADIATCRHTSQRTVANQLGAAFRRLGLSGRSSLVEYFLRQEVTTSAA